MKYNRLLLIVSLLVFLSCNSENDKKAPEITTTNEDQYAFIKGITEKSDSAWLDLDYIQYLTGDSAISAARRMDDLDSAINPDGTIQVGVTNDYYILNENDKVRRFALALNCKFDLLIDIDRLNGITENSLASLKRVYGDSPFFLTIRNGEIIEVKEVFIP
jgi:hypothetical protein